MGNGPRHCFGTDFFDRRAQFIHCGHQRFKEFVVAFDLNRPLVGRTSVVPQKTMEIDCGILNSGHSVITLGASVMFPSPSILALSLVMIWRNTLRWPSRIAA